MDIKDTRAAITQANFNNQCGGFILFEVVALAVCTGLYFSSWKVFGYLAFSLVLLILFFRKVEIFFSIIFTLCWTAFGFLIVSALFSSWGIGILGGIFTLLIVGGVHCAAYQWGSDIRTGNSTAPDTKTNSSEVVQNYLLVNNLYMQNDDQQNQHFLRVGEQ